MNELQLSLTRLIGKKEFTFGCLILKGCNDCLYKLFSYEVIYSYNIIEDTSGDSDGNFGDIDRFDKEDDEIIGHPATLSDFHKFILEKCDEFVQYKRIISIDRNGAGDIVEIPYDSSKELLNQSDETLSQIIELIRNQ